MKSKTRAPLYLVLALLACAHNAAGQSQTEPAQAAAWGRYTYPGEEFSVELPLMPQVFHTSRVVRYAPYDSDKMRVFGVYFGGVVYMIASFDRPRAVESDDRLAGYFWGGRGLTPKGEVKVGGVTGREYEVGLNFKGTARLFRTKRHAYLLKAFSDVEGNKESVERFLNSFALGLKPSGELIADDAPAQPSTPLKVTPAPGAVGIGPGRGSNTGGSAASAAGEESLKLVRRSGAAAEGGGPYRSMDVARRAVIVYKPEPGYTEDARRKSVTGVVRIRAVLSSSGKVTNISVVQRLPDGLTDRAIRAARHILFFPAVKEGREVSQYVVLEYNFNIY